MKDFFGIIFVSVLVILGVDYYYGPGVYLPGINGIDKTIKTLNEGKMVEQFPVTAETELNCALIHERKTYKTLILGSSRCETLTVEAMGSNRVDSLNACKSGLNFGELINIWGAWMASARPLERLVIMPDIWLLDDPVDVPSRCGLWNAQARGESVALRWFAADAKQYFDVFKELMSFDKVRIAFNFNHWYYDEDVLPDGSHRFPMHVRQPTQETVTAFATRESENFDWIPLRDPYRRRFVNMLRDSRLNGAKHVLVITPPYHPIVYAKNRKKIDEFDGKMAAMTKEAGADFYAGSDPSKSGCVETEFIDGRHPKTECLQKIWAHAVGAPSQTDIRMPSGG